jgi:hypothetical protein
MSKSNKQTDNYNLEAKLWIRRKLLEGWPRQRPLAVLDCCAGEKGEIWKALRRGSDLDIRYMGIDQKPVGRAVVQFDSIRWLREMAWAADFVDIDTYGEPWKHYQAAVDRELPELRIALTYGFQSRSMGVIGRGLCEVAGLPGDWCTRLLKGSSGDLFFWAQRPNGIRDLLVRRALGYPLTKGYLILQAWQYETGRNSSTYYWGLIIRRQGAGSTRKRKRQENKIIPCALRTQSDIISGGK